MAKLVSVFISESHRRVIGFLIWALAFVAVVCIFGSIALHQTAENMRLEARAAAEHFVRLRTNLLATFDVMHSDLTAVPCTPAFGAQLHKIAYLPDGLNEFLYAPGGKVHCSADVAAFDPPVDLGQPDIPPRGKRGVTLWVDHDLGFVGLPGMKGTVVLTEPFAVVVPPQNVDLVTPAWISIEAVLVANDDRWWHRSGVRGVYARQQESRAAGILPDFADATAHELVCDPHGLHCVAVEGDLLALLVSKWRAVFLALLVAGVIAAWATNHAFSLITRYWSFEARFCRHLDAGSIVCAYQPVMDLQTGETSGCEVLARWRDIDGSIVFPDRFIDVVERHGLTLRFTELVAERAYREMSEHLPAGESRLQVNFNIFPRDLDMKALANAFSGFASQPERYDVVLEIIESDEIPATAQREIEALRRIGIKTYIDDFGTGYSNMQNLAALSVDGVKLDRAFAMAPDNSVMAQMLRHAVEMIHATGRIMVVEGVETAERLKLLRNMQTRIDYVQGYFISRPLTIEAFADFLRLKPISLAERKRQAA